MSLFRNIANSTSFSQYVKHDYLYQLDFDGVGGSVNVGSAMQPGRTTPFSVSFFITLNNTDFHPIISSIDPSGNHPGLSIVTENGDIEFALSRDRATSLLSVHTEEDLLDSDERHHVVLTYSGSGLASGVKIYLDKRPLVLSTSQDDLTGTIVYAEDTKFGEEQGEFLNGQLDEVSYWNRVLTLLEVQELGDASSRSVDLSQLYFFDACINWWDCGDSVSGLGSDLIDLQGSDDGELIDGVAFVEISSL